LGLEGDFQVLDRQQRVYKNGAIVKRVRQRYGVGTAGVIKYARGARSWPKARDPPQQIPVIRATAWIKIRFLPVKAWIQRFTQQLDARFLASTSLFQVWPAQVTGSSDET
jgi:hypothetical protein